MNNTNRNKFSPKTILFLCCAFAVTGVQAITVPVSGLSFNPVVDGVDNEWGGIESTSISLTKTMPDGKSDIDTVTVKAGVSGDNVCFCFQWKDSSHDDQHKPYVWDETQGKYVSGPQREDRFAIQFAMEGDYDTNWLSGNEFKADIWHWKAARSNPIGIAQDKMTTISKVKIKKAYEGKAMDGSTLYIKRSSDAGDKLYTTKRYAEKDQDIMPKYITSENPQGSIADVKATGVWADGMWTLETCRKINTGNADDVVFNKGSEIKGGIAIFNHSGNADHNHSETLSFQF